MKFLKIRKINKLYKETIGILEDKLGLEIPTDRVNLAPVTDGELRTIRNGPQPDTDIIINELKMQAAGISVPASLLLIVNKDLSVTYTLYAVYDKNTIDYNLIESLSHELGHTNFDENSTFGRKLMNKRKQIMIKYLKASGRGSSSSDIHKINKELVENNEELEQNKVLTEGWASLVGDKARGIYLQRFLPKLKKKLRDFYRRNKKDISDQELKKETLSPYKQGLELFDSVGNWEIQKKIAMNAMGDQELKKYVNSFTKRAEN